MPFTSARDLKEDVLFRAGESTTTSQWNVKAIDYLNRAYRALCSGASEFMPDSVEDWAWMHSNGLLRLEPARRDNPVTVTLGSTAIVFDTVIADSVVGWRLRVDGHSDVYMILTHVAGTNTAVLDSPYNGLSAASHLNYLMKVVYSLDASAAYIMSPLKLYQREGGILGMSPERLDSLFSGFRFGPGLPIAFATETPQSIRFSHGGNTDGTFQRVEYRYKATVTDLTDSGASIPLVPIEHRHVLADMALVYIFADKNDDRAAIAGAAAKATLSAMARENKHIVSKMDPGAGRIFTRQGDVLGPRYLTSGYASRNY